MSAFPNEHAFVKGHLNIISSLPVSYPDDYQPPPEQYSRKISVLPVDLPPPPAPKVDTSSALTENLTIIFKSSKPPVSFTLTVSISDTVSTIKQQLAAQPRAPPADIQRLLWKGKALADGKLLKEYSVPDGATINLMTKPGSHWDASDNASLAPAITIDTTTARSLPASNSVPSLVVSPLPGSNGSPSSRTSPIPIEVDTTFPPVSPSGPQASSYHATISSPGFWDRLHLFLRTEFSNKDDAAAAFEQFLIASKDSLTVGEIAKIRDQVGVVGMAGT